MQVIYRVRSISFLIDFLYMILVTAYIHGFHERSNLMSQHISITSLSIDEAKNSSRGTGSLTLNTEPISTFPFSFSGNAAGTNIFLSPGEVINAHRDAIRRAVLETIGDEEKRKVIFPVDNIPSWVDREILPDIPEMHKSTGKERKEENAMNTNKKMTLEDCGSWEELVRAHYDDIVRAECAAQKAAYEGSTPVDVVIQDDGKVIAGFQEMEDLSYEGERLCLDKVQEADVEFFAESEHEFANLTVDEMVEIFNENSDMTMALDVAREADHERASDKALAEALAEENNPVKIDKGIQISSLKASGTGTIDGEPFSFEINKVTGKAVIVGESDKAKSYLSEAENKEYYADLIKDQVHKVEASRERQPGKIKK